MQQLCSLKVKSWKLTYFLKVNPVFWKEENGRMGLCTVYEPAAGHCYGWAAAVSQLNGHVRVLGTFPSSRAVALTPGLQPSAR